MSRDPTGRQLCGAQDASEPARPTCQRPAGHDGPHQSSEHDTLYGWRATAGDQFGKLVTKLEDAMGDKELPSVLVTPEAPSDQHWCKAHNEYDCGLCPVEDQTCNRGGTGCPVKHEGATHCADGQLRCGNRPELGCEWRDAPAPRWCVKHRGPRPAAPVPGTPGVKHSAWPGAAHYKAELERIALHPECPKAIYNIAADALCWARKHEVPA